MATANTTAEARLQAAAKSRRLPVSVDPSGWDPEIASSSLPNRHCAGTKRGEPAATGFQMQLLRHSAYLSAKKNGHEASGSSGHLTADWQGLGQLPTGVGL